ncbi:MAG: hypothetical protein Q9208_000742 [Pyrenodesmia sp. 3 TL-2023]
MATSEIALTNEEAHWIIRSRNFTYIYPDVSGITSSASLFVALYPLLFEGMAKDYKSIEILRATLHARASTTGTNHGMESAWRRQIDALILKADGLLRDLEEMEILAHRSLGCMIPHFSNLVLGKIINREGSNASRG